jgi:hypothetical protein
MIMLNRLVLILSVMMLLACGQKLQGKNSVKETKFSKRIKIGNTEAVAKLQPDDYNKLFSEVDVKKVNNTEDEFVYFNVKFNRNSTEDFNKEKILYLNFDMQNDFVLVKNKDSVAPAFCQRIENGVKNNFEYIVAFNKGKDIQKEVSLIYKDKIFSIGTVAFLYQ